MSFNHSNTSRRGFLGMTAALATAPILGLASQAPAQARVSQAPYYHFRLGNFEVTNILDSVAMLDGPWPIVGENRPAEDVERLMRDNRLPEKRFQPGFTPTLVNTGSELVLFDAGNGEAGFVPRPEGGLLASTLRSAGFSPDDVDVVVLTHAHPDHIGGLLEKGEPLFPNARYVMGAVEHNFWAAEDRLSAPPESLEYGSGQLFQSHVMPLADRMRLIEPGHEVTAGIQAIGAYGHTPGHLAFHIESDGSRMLLWGDAAHHEVVSLAKPDWHAIFDMDKELGAATRKRIYAMAAAERLLISGYHMSFPSLGWVEYHGSGYRWVPFDV